MNSTSTDLVRTMADALVQARLRHTTIAAEAWLRQKISLETAQATQREVAQRLGWFTGFPEYWKYGAPDRHSTSLQTPLPSAGILAQGSTIASAGLHHRLIEAEIALQLGHPVTTAQARELLERQRRAPEAPATLAAIDEVLSAFAVSLEMVDSRWSEGIHVPQALMLADQHGHGALTLGEWRTYKRQDWQAQNLVLRVSGPGGVEQEVSRHTGAHPLGDPTWLVPQWLEAITRHGATAPAGTVVTTGSWNGMYPLAEGATLTVDFQGYAPVRIS